MESLTKGQHTTTTLSVTPTPQRVLIESFEVDGPHHLRQRFIGVGERLQTAYPFRFRQDSEVIAHRLTSKFLWYKNGQARHFIARIDGVDVGRCSAMINLERTEDSTDHLTGLIGQWECEDGPRGLDAAHSLLEMATTWLRSMKVTSIVGPIDFSTWYSYRFMDGVGDERAALLTEPTCSPHSIEQWESFGFVRDESYFSAEIVSPTDTLAMAKPVAKSLLEQGWSVRQLRLDEWDQLIKAAYSLSMSEFTSQPYFTPIPFDEFSALYGDMKRGIDPRFVMSAWSPEGEFAGFVLGVRNLALALRSLEHGGLQGSVKALRESWRADTLMVKTVCVGRPYRRMGVVLLALHALYSAALDNGYARICHMSMHTTNRSRELTKVSGGVEFRSYVTLRLA